VSRGSRSRLPVWEGSGAAMCPMASHLASLLRRALTLPCVPRLWILPPCSGGLQCCHVSCDSGSCLPAREGSDAAMCHAAMDPASLLRRALALPRVPRLRILPPCSGGLRRCHVSHGTGPYLPAQEGFDAATCPAALWAAYLKNKERLRWPTYAA
jgi:hypothetical protein